MDNIETLQIKELNLDMIEPSTKNHMKPEQGGSKLVLIGKPGTGKSTVIESILYAKKHIIPVAVAQSGTELSNHFYKKIIPSTFVFNEYNEEQIEKFIKRQQIAKKHLENPWACIILDDTNDDDRVFRKPLQQGMYKRGRHWKKLYLLGLHYAAEILPIIRCNIDGTFIMREPNIKIRHTLYENYAGIIPDFTLFCKIMDNLTNDFTALYIHNATQSNNWQDCVFWYKAKKPPAGWKFGCEEYWEYHYARYDPEYVDPL